MKKQEGKMKEEISLRELLASIPSDMVYYRHENIPGGDLRVSITSQCNMRCTYCHNEGQGDFVTHFLPFEDFVKIIQTGKKFGAFKVRLTGGEPLLHPEVIKMLTVLKTDFGIKNVGLNTNGVLLTSDVVMKLLDARVDVVVVGIDYFKGKISKRSRIGVSSEKIFQNVLDAMRMGLNVQIASTFEDLDKENSMNIARWCRDHGVLLKILEVSDAQIAEDSSIHFLNLIKRMISEFDLRIGKTVPLDELYGVHGNGTRILFFQSHCRVRVCHECAHMHLRVTSQGKARPCLIRDDTEFDLLGSDPDLSMRRSIHNLGNPPEFPVK